MSLPILFFYGFAFIGIVHFLLFSKFALKKKSIPDFIMSLFLLAQSLIILEYVFFWTGLYTAYPYFNNISLPLQLLFGPLLYMYIDFSFFEKKRPGVYFLHFIPALLVFIFMLPYFFSSADLKINHIKMIPFFILNLDWVVYFIMLHMSSYFILLLIKILTEKRVAHLNKWILSIVATFGFYVACYLSYYILVRYPWFNLTTDYFVSFGMCLSILLLIYFSYSRKNILEGETVLESLHYQKVFFHFKENVKTPSPTAVSENSLSYSFIPERKSVENFSVKAFETEKKQEKYKNSGLTPSAVIELAESIDRLIKAEKLYRESEFKLETLAAKLGVAKHSVSQAINQQFGVNFFEYINLLRIHDAKELLANSSKKELSIIEIAFEVGYNTKNTFNTAFLRIVGCTPTEFRNKSKSK